MMKKFLSLSFLMSLSGALCAAHVGLSPVKVSNAQVVTKTTPEIVMLNTQVLPENVKYNISCPVSAEAGSGGVYFSFEAQNLGPQHSVSLTRGQVSSFIQQGQIYDIPEQNSTLEFYNVVMNGGYSFFQLNNRDGQHALDVGVCVATPVVS